jgi:hypothetical protein
MARPPRPQPHAWRSVVARRSFKVLACSPSGRGRAPQRRPSRYEDRTTRAWSALRSCVHEARRRSAGIFTPRITPAGVRAGANPSAPDDHLASPRCFAAPAPSLAARHGGHSDIERRQLRAPQFGRLVDDQHMRWARRRAAGVARGAAGRFRCRQRRARLPAADPGCTRRPRRQAAAPSPWPRRDRCPGRPDSADLGRLCGGVDRQTAKHRRQAQRVAVHGQVRNCRIGTRPRRTLCGSLKAAVSACPSPRAARLQSAPGADRLSIRQRSARS